MNVFSNKFVFNKLVRFFNSGPVPRLDWPTNSNLNYFWCSGSLLMFAMLLQLVTGIFCAIEYLNLSKKHLFHVKVGVGEPGPVLDGLVSDILRFSHLWGASLVFICLFGHMGRGLYYNSYSKNPTLWSIGMILYVVILAEAFLGYLLPWHQMSYWAGVVISTIFLSFPLIGPHLHSFLLGSYDFGDGIVSRVFCIHVCFGFVILGLIFVHFVNLHKIGSSNSFNSSDSYSDIVFFQKGYGYKDIFVFLTVLLITVLLAAYNPWMTSLKENFITPNPLATPTNIKPEWYFLPFYALLRSIESKMGGLMAVIILLLLVWVPVPGWHSGFESIIRRVSFWMMSFSFMFLGFLGSMEPTAFCQVSSLLSACLFCVSIFILKCSDYIVGLSS
uniref:Cytochrome b n=1 Tax=Pseudochauhanea macrorchis TaxID=1086615 RepID=H6U4R4_PSEMH|nr:cytochrome b [Pseudochauhanea macrorchis]AEO93250.1 cytochrome b [Pseudochauhanea macrorchis]